MIRVVWVFSKKRMQRILSETLIELVDVVIIPRPSSASLDSSLISALACGFLTELLPLAVAPCLRGYLEALCRMVTAGLSSENA